MTLKRVKSRKNISYLYFFCSLCLSLLAVALNLQPAMAADSDDASANENYVLEIEEKGGYREYLKGSDFNFSYDKNTNKVNYDNALLKQLVDNLRCNNPNPRITSQNARFEYNGAKYVVVSEVIGNEINKDTLYSKITAAVLSNKNKINLDEEDCYIKPSATADSEITKSTLAVLNKYVQAKITYKYAGKTLTIDGSTIHNWLSVDANNNVAINANSARGQIDYMANIYYNELGKSIPISGGPNGNNWSWSIDSVKETQNLINLIKSGQTITTSPAYKQNASGAYYNKFTGSTFIDVDLTNQYLWCYKNGYIVAKGSIVSGNLSASGCATPTGVYYINAKQTNTKLIGPDYESPVSYWMPFIRNSIGLHDASWRSTFGGQIYKTAGSHGCVNLPISLAQSVYNNISVGTPVMVHY